jgi:hypothetical protein
MRLLFLSPPQSYELDAREPMRLRTFTLSNSVAKLLGAALSAKAPLLKCRLPRLTCADREVSLHNTIIHISFAYARHVLAAPTT